MILGLTLRVTINVWGSICPARSLVSALKSDAEIPVSKSRKHLQKGYYKSERDVVSWAKECVAGTSRVQGHVQVCRVLDHGPRGDDIAYSVYNLEDAFKADFLSPLSLLSASGDLLDRVAERVASALGERFDSRDVSEALADVFHDIFDNAPRRELAQKVDDEAAEALFINAMRHTYSQSRDVVTDGYTRGKLTSDLLALFIGNVNLKSNDAIPAFVIRRDHAAL